MGTTIPRGELQGLVVLHRLILAVVEAYPYRFKSIDAFTDSLCSMGALEKVERGATTILREQGSRSAPNPGRAGSAL